MRPAPCHDPRHASSREPWTGRPLTVGLPTGAGPAELAACVVAASRSGASRSTARSAAVAVRGPGRKPIRLSEAGPRSADLAREMRMRLDFNPPPRVLGSPRGTCGTMLEDALDGHPQHVRPRRLFFFVGLAAVAIALASSAPAPAAKQMMLGLFDDAATYGSPASTF